jgi:hypothetical protein
VIVALVAAALVALGGGIAFVVSRINGLHSDVAVRRTPVHSRPQAQ